jgi:hypothetical protein
VSFRAEMTRARAELQALKARIGQACWSTGMVRYRIINDPEPPPGVDPEFDAFREEGRLWDGVSTIEIRLTAEERAAELQRVELERAERAARGIAS